MGPRRNGKNATWEACERHGYINVAVLCFACIAIVLECTPVCSRVQSIAAFPILVSRFVVYVNSFDSSNSFSPVFESTNSAFSHEKAYMIANAFLLFVDVVMLFRHEKPTMGRIFAISVNQML